MNQLLGRVLPESLLDPLDALLADVAIRIQLSATDYGKAEARNRTINDHLEREGSVLRGRVNLLYPQGSMAIGATIASRLRTDEFDIDAMAELAIPADTPPQVALDLLFRSVRGERGSRYYDMVERRTRCVTIHYADRMHIDVTPSVLRFGEPARTSILFHHKPQDPHELTYRLLANPWGFAAWFKEQTPLDHAFAAVFAKRAAIWESEVLAKRADSIPVPAQQGAHEKAKAVIVLQLLKRWRNVQYDRRNGRRPPSVMMAKLVADAANHTETLFLELALQAGHMRRVIGAAHAARQKVHVINPRCERACCGRMQCSRRAAGYKPRKPRPSGSHQTAPSGSRAFGRDHSLAVPLTSLLTGQDHLRIVLAHPATQASGPSGRHRSR